MNAARRTVLRRPASRAVAPRLVSLQLHPRFPQQRWQLLEQHSSQLLRPSGLASRTFCSDPGSAAERIQTKLAAHFAVRSVLAALFCCAVSGLPTSGNVLPRLPQDGTVEVEDVSGQQFAAHVI